MIASLLALPHMDADILKKLSKKRVRSQGELSAMSEDERTDALVTAGMHLSWHDCTFPICASGDRAIGSVSQSHLPAQSGKFEGKDFFERC